MLSTDSCDLSQSNMAPIIKNMSIYIVGLNNGKLLILTTVRCFYYKKVPSLQNNEEVLLIIKRDRTEITKTNE